MFSVVAKKSRSFFPVSHIWLMRRRAGAGGSTARQLAQAAQRSIPYHRHHALYMNGGWLRGRNSLFFLHKIHRFCNCCSGTGYTAGHRVVRNTVLCIACFAYTLLVAVVVFPLLSY